MKIVIVTIGTRGDVQPYLALAKGLISAGHSVTLCTHANFEPFAREHGVPLAPMPGDVQEILNSERGREILSRKNPIALSRGMTELAMPVLAQYAQVILEATRGADLILGSALGYFNSITAAQVNQVPLRMASLQWWTPTAAFPHAVGRSLPPGVPGAAALNRASYSTTAWALVLVANRMLNRVRADMTGLPPLGFRDYFHDLFNQTQPVFYPASPHILPRPAEWGANVHQTGFWFLDQASTYPPPPDLHAFLEAGPPPIFIGFGSMTDRDPAAMGALVRQAVRQAGVRAVILSGWAGLAPLDDPAIHVIDNAPHDWLFPRMAAVVHHGGMGTTFAALHAGVPQVIVPYSADQPFWAERAVRLGVASGWRRRYSTNAEWLAGAIRAAVSDARVAETARALGQHIRADQGVSQAVEAISRL